MIEDQLFDLLGYQCRIRKITNLGKQWLCGYVRLNPGQACDTSTIEVHGGITYEEVEEDGTWIGFDCAHYCDMIEPKDRRYVIAQIVLMIKQLEGAKA